MQIEVTTTTESDVPTPLAQLGLAMAHVTGLVDILREANPGITVDDAVDRAGTLVRAVWEEMQG
ncbi:hypothetical protein TSH100_03985 [Azospirillum sp. TSH100]|uniref:hypothetical protein n=1 Tax=Azospirillum sp. TSH100 TaxID=652764 RepID=UPI000D605FEC|nr:hypothetical protein [Azospirillum sp. TSH100]PWC89806.1 hypothetical protein TSH100_03985 [Azospirillum sp. TSH100]QCG92346.1 hypothetical protein E6C72_31570 [Azospirillum sp. TSH100]